MSKKIVFIDELRLKENNTYHTSIMLHHDGCSFLSQLQSDKFKLAFGQVPELSINLNQPNFQQWKNILQADSVLDQLFKRSHKISFFLKDYRFLLVPSSFFQENEKDSLFGMGFRKLDTEAVAHQLIPAIDAYILFPVNRILQEGLQQQFNNIEIKSYFQSWFDNILSITPNGPQVFLNYSDNQLDLVYLEDKKLMQQNNFAIQSEEDLVYYTLFALEQLELDKENRFTSISGEFDAQSGVFNKLKSYIPNIQLLERNTLQKAYYQINDIPKHHHHLIVPAQ